MPNEKLGCLGAILKLFRIDLGDAAGKGVSVDESLPYRLCDNFLSPAELAFFQSPLRCRVDSLLRLREGADI